MSWRNKPLLGTRVTIVSAQRYGPCSMVGVLVRALEAVTGVSGRNPNPVCVRAITRCAAASGGDCG